MATQVLVIHGGDTHNSYEEYLSFLKSWQLDFQRYRAGRGDWKAHLQEDLGEDFEVTLPMMPDKINAKYLEWKIWFEKFIPFLRDDVILIGHSLGGTFLTKYLAENNFAKKIFSLYLIAPAYDDEHSDYSMGDFTIPKDSSTVEKQADKISIFFSSDDPVVPTTDFKKFQDALPSAEAVEFSDRGHFNQEHLPELVTRIKGS